MLASLPMYDRLEHAAACGRYWVLIRDYLRKAGIEAPDSLAEGGFGEAFWTRPELLFSQTCGLPYRSGLHEHVHLIGTPDYGLECCPPGHYRSAIVIHNGDPREAPSQFNKCTFAYNDRQSQSGFAALVDHFQRDALKLGQGVLTGSHKASARAVADRSADLAAIDAATWRHIERYDEFACELRVLAWTKTTPGLPYICSTSFDPKPVQDAVSFAIDHLSSEDRRALSIKGLVQIPPHIYLQETTWSAR